MEERLCPTVASWAHAGHELCRGAVTHVAEFNTVGHLEVKTDLDFLGAIWRRPSRPQCAGTFRQCANSHPHVPRSMQYERRKGHRFLFLVHLTYQFGLELELQCQWSSVIDKWKHLINGN